MGYTFLRVALASLAVVVQASDSHHSQGVRPTSEMHEGDDECGNVMLQAGRAGIQETDGHNKGVDQDDKPNKDDESTRDYELTEDNNQRTNIEPVMIEGWSGNHDETKSSGELGQVGSLGRDTAPPKKKRPTQNKFKVGGWFDKPKKKPTKPKNDMRIGGWFDKNQDPDDDGYSF